MANFSEVGLLLISHNLLVAYLRFSSHFAGHNCVWHEQLPDWVTAGDFSASELAEIVTNHTATVVGHYKGQV